MSELEQIKELFNLKFDHLIEKIDSFTPVIKEHDVKLDDHSVKIESNKTSLCMLNKIIIGLSSGVVIVIVGAILNFLL